MQKGETLTVEMEGIYVLEVEVEIEGLGSSPSWDWDGGDPGDPLEFKILDIRLHPDEKKPPGFPDSLSKKEASIALDLDCTVEEFETRLYKKVDEAVADICNPDHDQDGVYNERGYRI